jgi:hypothetical protein
MIPADRERSAWLVWVRAWPARDLAETFIAEEAAIRARRRAQCMRLGIRTGGFPVPDLMTGNARLGGSVPTYAGEGIQVGLFAGFDAPAPPPAIVGKRWHRVDGLEMPCAIIAEAFEHFRLPVREDAPRCGAPVPWRVERMTSHERTARYGAPSEIKAPVSCIVTAAERTLVLPLSSLELPEAAE